MQDTRPKRQCKNCRFYPDDCGYWDKKYRDKHKNASFLNANSIHNCRDYSEKCKK